jgi:hypothetical protein
VICRLTKGHWRAVCGTMWPGFSVALEQNCLQFHPNRLKYLQKERFFMLIPFHPCGILIADEGLEILRDWKYDFSCTLRHVVLESARQEHVLVISKDCVMRALRSVLFEAAKKIDADLQEPQHAKAA